MVVSDIIQHLLLYSDSNNDGMGMMEKNFEKSEMATEIEELTYDLQQQHRKNIFLSWIASLSLGINTAMLVLIWFLLKSL